MKIQLVFLLFLASVLFACGDTSDELVGTWESIGMSTPNGIPFTMDILPDGRIIHEDGIVAEWWTAENNFCMKYEPDTRFCYVYMLDSDYLTLAETEEELAKSKDIWKRVSK